MVFPKLFKVDSKGKVREWSIITGRDTYPYYEVSHGVKDGALVSSQTHIKEGKNIGRANETTPQQQCEAEAKSLWEKQKNRKGYTETIPTEKPFLPMLAKTYEKEKKKVVYPCYGQPKLDGIRCLAICKDGEIKLVSRQGKEFHSLPHIKEQLYKSGQQDWEVYDGELYVHGEEFQELVGAIKRDKPTDSSAKVEYHIYDLVHEEWTNEERADWLRSQKLDKHDNLKYVEVFDIKSERDIDKKHKEYTDQGYEGIMVRNKQGLYKVNGRSSDLLKVKKFIDQEFPIVDAYENKGKMVGQCTFVCQTDDGTTFGVKPDGNEEIRKQFWTDWKAGRLTGAMLTVRFFSWTTSENPVPRFPVGIAIRDYE